jgi:lysyl-tRNA synthetase class I
MDFEELEDLDETQEAKRVYYKKKLLCPKCGKFLTILEMSVCSQGYIAFEVVCCKCGKEGEVVCSMHLLKKWAIQCNGFVYVDGNDTVN